MLILLRIYNDSIKTKLNAHSFYPKHYSRPYAHIKLSDPYRQLHPVGQVEHILGDYVIIYTPDGYTITDVYDFNKDRGHYDGYDTFYANLRREAGKNGSTDSDSNKYKNKFKIYRKLNHW